ncbi:GNAT family N-acetyltransferase [Corynebacterium aquatimens]|nr:GNAT family N-acetyltransferase [Corynebacterium aquatimens]UIZ93369.1 GNAT family N-acetyltransferase [Corynebacterium sp. CNCTC7651]
MPRPASSGSAHAADAEAVVGAYAFSATLAIQDITQLATSGVTASHIAKRLEGSAESEALLFGLSSRTALRPVGPLGYQELMEEDLLDIEAWVFISLPLLEDTRVIEANVTLDAAIAPLPGEEVPAAPWHGAFTLIDDLSARLNRPIRQLWVTHTPGTWEPPGATEHGYAAAFREDQAVFRAEAVAVGAGMEISVVEGPGFAGAITASATYPGGEEARERDTAQFSALLTAASRDYPRGELALETIEWDLRRITDAGARLMDRGGQQLTGIARVGGRDRTEDPGAIVGLCEAVHYSSDDDAVCELGLIYVLPVYRGKGVGTTLVAKTVARAREVWEDLETVYVSYPAGSPAAESITTRFEAEVVSSTTAWQKESFI